MSAQAKGVICGIVAAITYGTNPLGALNLYRDGINVDSVLFYRYGLAVVILAGMLAAQRTSFAIRFRDLLVCVFLGIIFAISSLSLFTSFLYMDAGIASTILFIYPVMVAVIMAVFFKEKVTVVVAFSIIMALAGIGLLYKGGDGVALSTVGIMLVMVSALTYAVYIVTVNKSGIDLPPIKLTFYVMLFGVLTIVLHALYSDENNIQLLTTAPQWLWALMLAVVPTVISLVLMVVAVNTVGSTPTAIMGALEPATAVVIGVTVFHEEFSLRIAAGMVLILLAVSLIIIEKPLRDWLRRKRRSDGPAVFVDEDRAVDAN
ncbi:MAG: DMT family transporter [Planctomycetes bacterium]|nr:DMT family transporter [Planctomycetota bacterium]